MFNDDMLIDTPDDMIIDDYAEDIETSIDDVIDNDGSDIDIVANITDEDLCGDYDEEDSYEDEYYDDDEDHVDYIVSNDDDDEDIKNDILNNIKNEEE